MNDDSEPRTGLPPHFLSRIAHDIRSPLGLLSGALEEIREDLGGSLDEGHLRLLALAERGIARLERMSRMLSTVAQIEARTLQLSPESYDLVRMVREVVELVEKDDPRRGLTVTLEAPSDAPVQIDPARTREALWELVGQSRRQAKSAVRIGLAIREAQYELRIEDDGKVDPAAREWAFDRYHEPEGKRGTGLALSVARDLVRAHGGDVTISDGGLSAFTVTLPR